MQPQPIYVIDTNVLISFPDVIPNGDDPHLEEPTVDLSSAHIVLPQYVITELKSFTHEKHSSRGAVAKVLIARLRALFENNCFSDSINDAYRLNRPISIGHNGQKISIVPLHQHFCDNLPFKPSTEDHDGQILAITLATIFAAQDLPVDGTAQYGEVNFLESPVTLLTNDNEFAIRAATFNIHSSRYGYKLSKPYSGRRDVTVPPELFRLFWNGERRIYLNDWIAAMPNEPTLVPNEFVRLTTNQYPIDFDPHSDIRQYYNIGRYDVDLEAIVPLAYFKKCPDLHPKTAGQAMFLEALLNPNIASVICVGPAGTGKTYLTTVYSYLAAKAGDYIGISVVPCDPPNSKLGALPGGLGEKLDPHVGPIKNSLKNYLLQSKYLKKLKQQQKFGSTDSPKVKKKKASPDLPNDENPSNDNDRAGSNILKQVLADVDLIYGNWFGDPISIEFAKGLDFAYQIALYDEFQDHDWRQADTLLKRLGENGKMIITGDTEQVHNPYNDKENNGITYASHLLRDSSMVAQISFEDSEVVRHPLVAFIAKRQESTHF